jgi:hypothetical protein
MSAIEFRIWQVHMGWNNSEIARRLHLSRGTVQKYADNGAPLYIALAAAALAVGLTPWKTA